MIYLFHGSDVGRVRAKAFSWIQVSREKQPEAIYLRIGRDDLTESSLAEAVSAQGLFFSKALVLLDDPFADAESAEIVVAALESLQASSNPIAILAPKLLATRVKKIEALGAKVFKVDAIAKASRGFNSALVNALAAKDGKALWKEIVKAYRQGDAPEMLHGLLHWKARDLMQKGSRVWGERGARTLSRDLIELLSDSRGRDVELSLALERFALSL